MSYADGVSYLQIDIAFISVEISGIRDLSLIAECYRITHITPGTGNSFKDHPHELVLDASEKSVAATTSSMVSLTDLQL